MNILSMVPRHIESSGLCNRTDKEIPKVFLPLEMPDISKIDSDN